MARQAGELTVAIRALLDKNADLTCNEAIPLLQKDGFDVPKPSQKKAFGAWVNNFNVTKYNWRKQNGKLKSAKTTGSKKPAKRVATVVRPKYGPKTGSKPQNGKSAQPKRRMVATHGDTGVDAAVALVKRHGGIKSAKAKVEELRAKAAEFEAQANELNTAVETLGTMSDTLKSVA